jgi:uncharacterized protein
MKIKTNYPTTYLILKMFKIFHYIKLMQYAVVGLLLLQTAIITAKETPPRPSPPRLVNDYAGMLNRSELDALERKLVAYDDSTSTQIAIVIERTLEGDDDFDYALRIYNTWNIGQKDKNNGVLIYIALDDRRIRIITGYGAEGFLPDAIAKRIIENIIKPAFREQRYYEGFDRATDAIINYAAGEYSAEEEFDATGFVIGLAILIIIVAFFIFIIVAAIRSGKHYDDHDDGGYWRGGRYEEPRHRSRGGGGWMVFPPSGGGGGGGWSGGGGFGGFGGGFSGGGGAGGSW